MQPTELLELCTEVLLPRLSTGHCFGIVSIFLPVLFQPAWYPASLLPMAVADIRRTAPFPSQVAVPLPTSGLSSGVRSLN